MPFSAPLKRCFYALKLVSNKCPSSAIRHRIIAEECMKLRACAINKAYRALYMAKIAALVDHRTWTEKAGAKLTTYWRFREPRNLFFLKVTNNKTQLILLYNALEILISVERDSPNLRLDNINFIPS